MDSCHVPVNIPWHPLFFFTGTLAERDQQEEGDQAQVKDIEEVIMHLTLSFYHHQVIRVLTCLF